jgi:hypothetical protein
MCLGSYFSEIGVKEGPPKCVEQTNMKIKFLAKDTKLIKMLTSTQSLI